MSFNLIALTDAWMTRERFTLPGKPSFYPSEASVSWVDHHGIPRVSGCCLRKAYYRITDGIRATPPDAYSEWVFALGKAVEQILVDQWKAMGILVANNVKFYDEKRNISGEIDVIIKDPNTGDIIPVEVKSFASYQATKEIMGNKSQQGRPKTSQMLQTLVYLDLLKDQVPYAKMIYYARDSGQRRQFDIAIVEDGGVHRPTIDGVVDYRFTIEDMFDRYKQLTHYVENRIVPPNDYELIWDDAKVEQRKLIGEVSKSAYENWKRNKVKNPIGCWNCKWCQYPEVCWGKNKWGQ